MPATFYSHLYLLCNFPNIFPQKVSEETADSVHTWSLEQGHVGLGRDGVDDVGGHAVANLAGVRHLKQG